MRQQSSIRSNILKGSLFLLLLLLGLLFFLTIQLLSLPQGEFSPQQQRVLSSILKQSLGFTGLVFLLASFGIGWSLRSLRTYWIRVHHYAVRLASGERDLDLRCFRQDEGAQPLQTLERMAKALRDTETSLAEQTKQLDETHQRLNREIADREAAEQALCVSQQYAKSIINSSLDMIIAVDTERKVIEFNAAAQKTFGYSAEEIIGKHITRLYAENEQATHIYQHTVNSGQCVEEIMNTRKNGELFPCLLSASILRDSQNVPIGYMGISRDITAQKQAEAALRESQQYAESLIESSLDMIIAVDLDRKIVGFNRAAQEDFGYTMNEIRGKRIDALYLTQQEALAIHHAALTEGHCSRETANIRKNHSVFPGLLSASILKNAEGTTIGVMGILRDITVQKQNEARLRQHNQDLNLLSRLSELLQVCHSERETYAVMKNMCEQFFPHDSGYLAMLDDSQTLLEIVSSWGGIAPENAIFGMEDCWAIRRGKLHMIEPSDNGPLCLHLSASSADGYLCMPISAPGELLGILHLSFGQEGTEEPGDGSQSKRMIVSRIAEQYALSLANLRLRETLEQDSIRDLLTGMYNRRYMEGSLERETRRAERHQKPVGVIMLDLDHFKLFNDTHGHEAGDAVLKELGVFLRKNTRGEDIACRYGGEEFLLIMPDANLDDTRRRAEKLQKEVQLLEISYQHKILHATISVGVAALPEHGRTVKDVLRAADVALYKAKEQGRNRVVTASMAVALN